MPFREVKIRPSAVALNMLLAVQVVFAGTGLMPPLSSCSHHFYFAKGKKKGHTEIILGCSSSTLILFRPELPFWAWSLLLQWADGWGVESKDERSQPSAVQGSWNWSRRRWPLELQPQLSTGGFPNISKISVSLSKVWHFTVLHQGTVREKSSLDLGVPSDLLNW